MWCRGMLGSSPCTCGPSSTSLFLIYTTCCEQNGASGLLTWDSTTGEEQSMGTTQEGMAGQHCSRAGGATGGTGLTLCGLASSHHQPHARHPALATNGACSAMNCPAGHRD